MLSIEGNILNKNQVHRGRIEINESGTITKIGEPEGSADFVFKDEIIFPGFIDLHVHAREDVSHQFDYKEDFATAGESAINGGVVAFAEMPNNPVPPVDDASYKEKNNLTKKSKAEVLLYAGIGAGTSKLSKKVPYKVFMGHSVGDLFFINYPDLEKAIEKYAGENVSFHCEDPEILESKKSESNHEDRRPAEAEISAVDFALHLIEKYNLVGKICHCSTLEGVEKIVNAKKRGVNVSVEVTPHHLYFDESMFDEKNHKVLQVNPPIRQSKENRLALIKMLKEGDIDHLATDHAPHTLEEKEKGISGMPHLDTYGAFTTWLIKEHGFTPLDIARVCSQNPGIFMNSFLPDKYGEIKKGYSGSLAVIDLEKPMIISRENLKTKCGWSPFEGVTFPGSVVMTVVKGKVFKK